MKTSVRQRGMILVPLVFLFIVLGGLVFGLVHEGHANREWIRLQENRVRAKQLAETAVVRSAVELRGGEDVDADGLGTLAGTYGGGIYEVVAQPDAGDSSLWRVVATGEHRQAVRRIEAGMRVVEPSPFRSGIVGRDWVSLGDESFTESYDSRLGSPGSQPRGEEGDIDSNGWIQLGDGSTVYGDAIPGPFDTVSIGGGSSVTGSTTPRSEEMEIDDPPRSMFEDALASNDNGSLPSKFYNAGSMSLRVTDERTLTLSGGTYFFTDVLLRDRGTLKVTGPVTIYVTGPFRCIDDGRINNTGIPSDLTVFAHPYDLPAGHVPPATSRVDLRDGSGIKAVVYAPSLPVSIPGETHVHGAVVGRTVRLLDGSDLTYDEALEDYPGWAETDIEWLYWIERSPPPR